MLFVVFATLLLNAALVGAQMLWLWRLAIWLGGELRRRRAFELHADGFAEPAGDGYRVEASAWAEPRSPGTPGEP